MFHLEEKAYHVLIELSPRQGTTVVSRLSPEQLAAKSAMAMDHVMSVIQQVARRISATANAIAEQPDARPLTKVEMTFGLKVDTEADVLITKAGAEAAMQVKLTWEKV